MMIKIESAREILVHIVIMTLFILTAVIAIPSEAKVYAAQPFNVDIDLPETYRTTTSGTEMWFTVKMLNLANSKRVDVTLNYEILDSRNVSIAHNGKTVAVETQASFVASLALPADLKAGTYQIHVLVGSSMGDSEARMSFQVVNPREDMTKYYYIGAAVLGLILLVIIISVIMTKSRPFIEKMKLKMKIKRIVKEKLKEK